MFRVFASCMTSCHDRTGGHSSPVASERSIVPAGVEQRAAGKKIPLQERPAGVSAEFTKFSLTPYTDARERRRRARKATARPIAPKARVLGSGTACGAKSIPRNASFVPNATIKFAVPLIVAL